MRKIPGGEEEEEGLEWRRKECSGQEQRGVFLDCRNQWLLKGWKPQTE